MTQSQLDRLRELLSAATPGPWVSTGFDYEPEAGWFIREDSGGRQRKAVARIADSFRSREEIEANAALIVALRNGADELLDEVERMKAAGEALYHETLLISGTYDDFDPGQADDMRARAFKATQAYRAALHPKQERDDASQ